MPDYFAARVQSYKEGGIERYVKMANSSEEEKVEVNPKLERRDFVKGLGKFAALTPPAVTMLLDVSMNSSAIAASGGKPGWGFGDKNHTHTGPRDTGGGARGQG